MLKSIHIKELFNKFNYSVNLKEEGVTILTGPNGYGKTTILKILDAFAHKNLLFLLLLPFKEIVLVNENYEIRAAKTDEKQIVITKGDEKAICYEKINMLSEKKIKRRIDNFKYIQLSDNRWKDRRTEALYTVERLFRQLIENDRINTHQKQMPEFADVYFISEQRLIGKTLKNKKNSANPLDQSEKGIQTHNIYTIEEYAKELAQTLKEILAKSSKIGQELDSTFPRRLFDENNEVGEEEFSKRYNIIAQKQQSLNRYGLSAIKEDARTVYKPENAKALLVYLNDTEKKLAVFDEILQKLDIFLNILTQRQFVNKRLEISPDFGFSYSTEDGKAIELISLSSGEQQEVVILFDLLFRVSPDTLVLIDEPEISLHVAWQKELINDFLKIARIQKIHIITATHSPQIIGEHWDLAVDLWDLSKESAG